MPPKTESHSPPAIERRRADSNYRAIFEAADSAIALLDWDTGAFIDVNPSGCLAYGYTHEEMLRLTAADISSNEPPYTAQEAARLLKAAKTSVSPVRFEWHRRNKDGSLHWDEMCLKAATLGGRPHVLAFSHEITERRLAEQGLRASEARLRATVAGALDCVLVMDEQGGLIEFNPAAEACFGWRRADVIGKTLAELIVPPRYREAHLAGIARFRATGVAKMIGRRVELSALRADGSEFPAELAVTVAESSDGRLFVGYLRDITERLRAERLLRDSEEQYRAIFTSSADAMVLRDADFKVVDVNPAYTTMSGYTREEGLGTERVLTISMADSEHWRAAHEQMLAGKPLRFEFAAHRKDGTPYEAEVRGMPVTYQGRPHVLYVTRDITDRKRAEQALRASEEQYRAIFNATADAMVLRDESMRVVDVNPAFLAMHGKTRDEIVGYVHRAFVVVPQLTAAEGLLRDTLAGRSGKLEVQLPGVGGAILDIDLRTMPMQYQGRTHMLAIGRDVTAERRGEREKQRLEGQLRQAQKMEAIGHVTGGVAHDFNNILASIMGYNVLALERCSEAGDARTAAYLEQALASCRRARDLIEQMLMFSRGQRGEPRPLKLGRLVQVSTELLCSMLPSTIEFAFECDDAAAPVLADEIQAGQVLLNLCINARDATGGTGRLRVAVRTLSVRGLTCASCRAAVDGLFTELAVADSGCGIDPQVLDRMFEPFFSTKDTGKGSGMGLSMVHGIVHEHRGHVVVETEPGRGSTFRVLWPALSANVAPVAATAGDQAKRAKRKRLSGRVLLVDDEASVRGCMQELLSGWGLAVTTAADAAQALHAFATADGAFDLVIADQAMPIKTGLTLAVELRAQNKTLPILLCSGYADDATADAAQRCGVQALLRKPIEPAELRSAVEAAMHGSTGSNAA